MDWPATEVSIRAGGVGGEEKQVGGKTILQLKTNTR
jgi:hypothetical protein